MKSQKFVPQILAERGSNWKENILQLISFFTFFRANYAYKGGVKCTVDHRVVKIYKSNGSRNKKT